jgi:heptaprenyl diphosphate synthase
MVRAAEAALKVRAFESFRLKRRAAYEGLFSARALCIAGLLMMPALLFNPIPLSRAAQFLFFWLLAWLSGAKNNPLITVLIIVCIAAFNLIVPYGRVLCVIGIFKITSGALLTGIQRAVTLEGLIMLSRFAVRRDIRIPGKFGELVGESFRVFALILDRKGRVTRENFIAGIDRLMIELDSGDDTGKTPPDDKPAPALRTGTAGIVMLAAAILLAWLPWIFIVFSGRPQ